MGDSSTGELIDDLLRPTYYSGVLQRSSRKNYVMHPFGEASLQRALHEYVEHYHHERNHQGKGNVLLFPSFSQKHPKTGPMQCHERLGGLLKYYTREAA
jgi:hypothetical protein